MKNCHFPRIVCTLVALAVLYAPNHAFAQADGNLESLRGVATAQDLAKMTPEQQDILSKLAGGNPQVANDLTICWDQGTDASTIEAFETALRRQIDAMIGYQPTGRWTATVQSGAGLQQGDPTVVTWSIVPDGTNIDGFIGEPTAPSNLIAFLTSIYGVVTNNTDYTDEAWFPLFQSSFDRWTQLTGLVYVYEPNDDGANFAYNPGVATVRGDVRVGGHLIDGNSGVLAYNFFPNTGDMVIDTADNFYSNTASTSLRLRNVLMHEAGHGLGLRHVESSTHDFLMEPFINLSFDGPQFDDILGGNRHYGDYEEPPASNDNAGNATSLGALGYGGTANRTMVSVDDNSDFDYYAFTVGANSDVNASVVPQGFTYNEGPQNGAQSPYSPQNFGDLQLEILDTNGITVLGNANNTGLGGSEAITVSLPGAGTFYVRVRHNSNEAQMYNLDLDISETNTDCVSVSCAADIVVGNGLGSGSNFDMELCFTNCGPDTADIDYTISDTAGWCATPGGTVTLAPGATHCVTVACAVPGSTPGGSSSTLTLIASTSGGGAADTCSATISVDATVPVDIHGMQVSASDRSVDLRWSMGDNWRTDLLGVQVQRSENFEGPYDNVGDQLQPAASMSFVDDTVQPERRYFYRVISIAVDGNTTSPPVEVVTSDFNLVTQLYTPALTSERGVQIRYDLGRDSNMRLEIYDARGRRVRALEQGARNRGAYVVQWNGRDDSGAMAARGVYFISLNTDRQLFSRKVVLAR